MNKRECILIKLLKTIQIILYIKCIFVQAYKVLKKSIYRLEISEKGIII